MGGVGERTVLAIAGATKAAVRRIESDIVESGQLRESLSVSAAVLYTRHVLWATTYSQASVTVRTIG